MLHENYISLTNNKNFINNKNIMDDNDIYIHHDDNIELKKSIYKC